MYGKLRLHSHEEAIEALKKLVDKYEVNSANPVRVENFSPKMMREVCGIVSFEIEISSI